MQKEQNVSLNVSAKTVDEAIELGLSQLALSRNQVEIEIVNEGKRGIFGLGAEEAVVRLTVISRPAQAPEPLVSAATFDPPATLTTAAEPELPSQAVTEQQKLAEQQKLDGVARNHLANLLKYMGIKADIVVRTIPELGEPGEEVPLVLDIVGKDLGILIGRRNETLQALQFMVRLMTGKETGGWQHVVVDVESYRERHRESLQKMAQRMAERVVASGERMVLEAMPPYERRIIHMTLRDHPSVYTKSVGYENNRKVTIIPK